MCKYIINEISEASKTRMKTFSPRQRGRTKEPGMITVSVAALLLYKHINLLPCCYTNIQIYCHLVLAECNNDLVFAECYNDLVLAEGNLFF